MGKDSVRVCARFRPQNKLEKSLNCHRCVQISDCKTVCEIKNPNVLKPYRFILDHIFDTDASQPHVFNTTVKELVSNVMKGFNCTVFAYGQTGTGKTYSMEGELGSTSRGIIPRVVEFIFQLIEDSDEVFEFTLKVSYCEIYLERLRDLLNPKNKTLKIRENKAGIYIQGVTEMYVRDEQEVMKLMIIGGDNRTVQGTRMNAVSSRSHAVFMLKLISKHTETGSTKMSKLLMVDLAGSEKVGKTEASGSALEEAKKINQSLSALGNVMNALTEGAKHIPYRDSVLTKLLSDSLGGNCKTCLLIACSCSSYSAEETISTMRFGVRAKKIKNKAKVNAEKTVAEYKKEVIGLNKTIRGLRKMVACLKHDLELSKKGELTEENELAAKLERGEEVVLEIPNVEEEKEAPKEITFGGAKKSSPKAKKDKKPEETRDANATNEPKAANASEDSVRDPRTQMGGFPTMGKIPTIRPTAEAGVFSIGDQIVDKQGREGVVQRVFYIEDVDVRWQDETVTYKIPAPLLAIKEEEGKNKQGDLVVLPSISDFSQVVATGKSASQLQVPKTTDKSANVLSDGVALNKSEAASQNQDSQDTATGKENETEVDSKETTEQKNTDGEISEHGTSMARNNSEKNNKEKETVSWSKYKKATRLALSLQKEIDNYRIQGTKQSEVTRQVMNKIQSVEMELNIKGEALQKERLKTEEAEAECTKAILQLRALEDTHSTMSYEKKKLEREVVELNQRIASQEAERTKLRAKFDVLKKEAENELNKVRKEEKQRAKKFIEAAQKAINRSSKPVKRLMRENERMQRNRAKKGATKNDPSEKEQPVNAEMLKEMQTLKLEQLKLEQDLRAKVEDFINLKMKLVEKDDQLGHLQNDVKNKDLRLRHQHEELKALGKLKLESDKYHSEKAARDQQRIIKLKRTIGKLKRKRKEDKKGHISKTRQKKMRGVVVSLRGGGGKKTKKKGSKSKKREGSPTGSVASSYVPKKKSVAQAYMNSYSTLNPSGDEQQYSGMRDNESDYKQMDPDEGASQASFASYSGAYYSQNSRANKLAIYEEDLPDIPPVDAESSIDGHSYSGYSMSNPYDAQSTYQDYGYSNAQLPQSYSYQLGNSYAAYGGNAYNPSYEPYY